jgi:transcriptional regulator with XRE-family HTH domain
VLKQLLGSRISCLRRQKNLTQEELAEATDYSVEFISFVERGINGPSIDGLERLACALEVEVKELFDFAPK